jgi:casein kinase 1
MVAAKFEKRNDHEKGVSLLIREIKVLTEVSGIKGIYDLVNRGFP